MIKKILKIKDCLQNNNVMKIGDFCLHFLSFKIFDTLKYLGSPILESES